MELTGTNMLKLIVALEQAVDNCGKGEMRGIRLLTKLNELGIDVVLMERPAPRLVLTAPDSEPFAAD